MKTRAMSHVACFGEILVDVQASGAPEAGLGAARLRVGGAAANVAVGLARLGVRAELLGVVGRDALGDRALGDLEGEGVDVRHVARVDGRTPLVVVAAGARGEPTFAPYRVGTADARLEPLHARSAAGASVGVLATTTLPGDRGLDAALAFVDAVRKDKGLVVVDLNVRPGLGDADALRAAAAKLVAGAHVVKASESDLLALAGKRGVSWLEANARGAVWLLTRAEAGAAAVGPFGSVSAPTRRVRVVDASGAGDAFVAGVVATLLHGDPARTDERTYQRALEVGQAMGAKAVLAEGATAGLGDLADLRARIASSGEAAGKGSAAAPKKSAAKPAAAAAKTPAKSAAKKKARP